MAAAFSPTCAMGDNAAMVGMGSAPAASAPIRSVILVRLFLITYAGRGLSGLPRGSPIVNGIATPTLPAFLKLSASLASAFSADDASLISASSPLASAEVVGMVDLLTNSDILLI